MDHAATMTRMYDLLSAGDIDGFGDLVADDFIEHEDMPGLERSKEGVKQLFRMTTCQPSTSFATTPWLPPSTALPGPNGNS